jgi:hypothetical protein
MKTTSRAVLAVAAGLGLLAGPRIASAETETFTATLLSNADVRQAFSRTWPVTFHVQSWTSEEELARLEAVLKEGGSEALLREFRKGRGQAGYVTSPAIVRQPSWRVAMATSVDTPRGRVVRLLTDRPIGFAESWSGARSLDYEFAVFQFTLDEKGRGQGTAIPAARLVQYGDGQLTFETLPYTTGPDRLIGVRQWRSDKPSE